MVNISVAYADPLTHSELEHIFLRPDMDTATKGPFVILSKTKAGSEHTITACHASGRTRARLDSLGLVVGEQVHVLSCSWAGLILEIKGSRLAVCKAVADTMEVSD